MPEEIRFERRGALGIIVLDRPQALNALTRPMVAAMSAQLAGWRDDHTIAAVLVKAVPGRAFCAGGDVRAVVEGARDQGVDAVMPFFHDEYRLNWRIRNLGKPYVALIDGVTMGGGVGISVHGTHRIATARTLFAMPETGIGFFPDVGGSWFLPRCPGETGTWLGLTGARLGPADCLAAGIATHFVPDDRLGDLEAELAIDVEGALHRLCTEPDGGEVAGLRSAIDAAFVGDGPAALIDALAAEPTGWGAAQLAILREKSPFAVAVTLAQLRAGRQLDFDGCMRLEHRMVRRMLAGSEFAEGVRALLIDKDKRPAWAHARVEDVPPDEVVAVLAPSDEAALPLDWNRALDWDGV